MTDFHLLDEKLTEEERDIQDRLRAVLREPRSRPMINGYWERAEFPLQLVPKIAAPRWPGGTVEGYWLPALRARPRPASISHGVARADGSVDTFFGVHSNLADAVHRCRWPGGAEGSAGSADGRPGRDRRLRVTEPEHG